VPRRVTLVALWAVFAAASVSVGFAAAGLVSDPFTDARTTTEVTNLAGSGAAPVTEPDGGPNAQATGAPAPSTQTPDAQTPTVTPSTSGATRSAAPTRSARSAPSVSSTVKSGIPTEGGYVSGTCRGGLVSVGAAPAVYWRVESKTPGRVHTARVRLEPVQDARGERVDVTVSCPGGKPAFTHDYSPGGGGGDDSGGRDGNSGAPGEDGGDAGGDG
jgi:hypothetical protein